MIAHDPNGTPIFVGCTLIGATGDFYDVVKLEDQPGGPGLVYLRTRDGTTSSLTPACLRRSNLQVVEEFSTRRDGRNL